MMSNPYRALLGKFLPIALETSPEPVYPFWKNCVEAAMSVLSAVMFMGGAVAHAEEIGSVDTAKTMIGPNHRIAVEAFDDPKVAGVACHLSRAITGGAGAAIGISEDTSDASIACRQVGKIEFLDDLIAGEKVFEERRSVVFKTMQVVRFCDEARNTLAYLVYSKKLIDGSPKNSLSTVPISNWGDGEPPRCLDT